MVSTYSLETTETTNVYTGYDQYFSQITALPGGGYVITWMSRSASGDNYDIFTRAYDSDGLPVTNDVRVNSTTTNTQFNPAITHLSDGGYIVTWVSDSWSGSPDGSGYGVYSQRYEADGDPVGGNTLVNTSTSGNQGGNYWPGQGSVSVTGLDSGGYVVVWQGNGTQTGQTDSAGVFGRYYDASGTPGSEFRINSTTTNTQSQPEVVGLSDGGFMVVWTSYGQDTSTSYGVYAQRYDNTGAASGGEQLINTYSTGDQIAPKIAVLDDGGYVIAWDSAAQDGSGRGIFAQRYEADGDPVGSEFQVNTYTSGDQRYPRVTALDDGGFIVSWTSVDPSTYRDPGTYAFFQRYDAAGNRIGPETAVTEAATDGDLDPQFVLLSDGSLAVTWWEGSNNHGSNTSDVHHRVFRATTDLTGAQLQYGTAGNDSLDGGAGNDTMYGGAGDDTYAVDSAGDSISEDVGFGTDLVNASVSYALSTNIENLTLTGTGHISGTGNELSNLITGNSGNNTLTGGLGNDTLAGGTGNDTYYIDSSSDVVVEAGGSGTDTIYTTASYGLSGRYVEYMYLTGTGNINATGNSLVNNLFGNSGDNRIDGLAHADNMTGGAGNDTYVVDNSSDNVVELTGEGTDTVEASATYVLAANVENLILTGSDNIDGTGNALDNTLTGNSGINTLAGGAGNDTYVIGATDTVTENTGEGTDTVLADFTYSLGANVENLTLTGSSAINGTGNDLDNVLTGNSGNNTLTGGLGNDTYYIQNTGDVVVEAGGSGTADTIYTSVSYSLSGRYIEYMYLTGSDNINATGNSLTNHLFGNSGNNQINGKGGADDLSGGLGADIFLFETASGSDTILDFSAADGDQINVNAYSGGTAYGGGITIIQSGDNTLIDLGGGNFIVVEDSLQSDVASHMIW